MDELVRWLGEQLDEDELWAIEASRRYGEQAPNGGVHWQWETIDDEVLTPDPGREEFVGGVENSVSLRSQETWPTRSVRELPQFAIHSTQEVPSAVAGHIVRWDPARVLREIDAKRQLLTAYAEVAANDVHDVEYAHGYANALGNAVCLLALPYADRPGYKESWRP